MVEPAKAVKNSNKVLQKKTTIGDNFGLSCMSGNDNFYQMLCKNKKNYRDNFYCECIFSISRVFFSLSWVFFHYRGCFFHRGGYVNWCPNHNIPN